MSLVVGDAIGGLADTRKIRRVAGRLYRYRVLWRLEWPWAALFRVFAWPTPEHGCAWFARQLLDHGAQGVSCSVAGEDGLFGYRYRLEYSQRAASDEWVMWGFWSVAYDNLHRRFFVRVDDVREVR